MGIDQFRELLETTMRTRDWSLSRLGREAGIQPSIISRWLNAPSNGPMSRPSPRNLEKLAPVLGVPYEDLMRVCGYLPPNGDLAEVDPDVAAIAAVWPSLDEGIRRAVRILSGLGGVTAPRKDGITASTRAVTRRKRASDGGLPIWYPPVGHLALAAR